MDAGSAGASTFLVCAATSSTSPKPASSVPEISGMGMISQQVGELEDLRWADPAAAIKVCEDNRDVIIGIKIRITRNLAGPNVLQALVNAREAAEAVGLPIMVHPNDPDGCSLDEVLAHLRPGDIVTHCFHGNAEGIIGGDGRVRETVKRAVDQGVRLDVGHGQGSFDFDVAKRALAEGIVPGHHQQRPSRLQPSTALSSTWPPPSANSSCSVWTCRMRCDGAPRLPPKSWA